MKRIYSIILILIVVILTAYLFFQKFYITQNKEQIIINIPPGSSTAYIASLLKKKGIILSTRMFVYQCRSLNVEKDLKAGKYMVFPKMRIKNLINKLRFGITMPPPLVVVSIPEGYNIRQIARKLNEDTKLIEPKEFIRICNDRKFIRSLGLDVPSLEGFLFPDTYKFFVTTSETDIILTMYDNFRSKVKPIFQRYNNFNDFYRILKIASIVEKETRIDTERPIVAAVYYNRLKRRYRLEADPTVRYALGKDTGILTYRDLKVKSPYNTYKYFGLPPTPICNPGLASIEAAANPADVDFLYFVSNANGAHYFSSTFKEHLRNKSIYKRNLRKKRLSQRQKK